MIEVEKNNSFKALNVLNFTHIQFLIAANVQFHK